MTNEIRPPLPPFTNETARAYEYHDDAGQWFRAYGYFPGLTDLGR